MIGARPILDGLVERGATLLTGVPCSLLGPLIEGADSDPRVRHIVATSEGEAAGIAVGTWLAGGIPVVLCQNSGLGNLVNPLTSLAWPSRIPMLVLCSWRGRPGQPDEPQHELMGRATLDLLAAIEVAAAVLPTGEKELGGALDAAWTAMRTRSLPFCLMIGERLGGSGALEPPAARSRQAQPPDRLGGRRRLTRVRALARVLELAGDDVAIVATTGKTGRELFMLGDRPQHFYQVGAMGCASAVALGVALSTPRRVLVLDGDGAALMRLGNMATIGDAAPPNLVHVVLDNGVHDSTGGQRTAGPATDFAAVALACGYRRAVTCDGIADFGAALATALDTPGPQLVHLLVRPGSTVGVGRPTAHPSEVARRFREFVITAPSRAAAA